MSGPRSRRVVELQDVERVALEALTRPTTVAVALVQRARIVLLATAACRPIGSRARWAFSGTWSAPGSSAVGSAADISP